MKPRADGGVVDSKLNVYGLQGLKVAGNVPMPTCYMVPPTDFPTCRRTVPF